MPRKKPAHQWETRSHLALRTDEHPVSGFEDDGRAEAFALQFKDGRVGRARLGLARQTVDSVAQTDPELIHAVKCWLCARGVRQIRLEAEDTGRVLNAGCFCPQDLGDVLPRPPARLITLCPSNAEMVHALGCFERVIACEDSSDYPAAVASLERLGPDLGPNLDRVAELEPDAAVSSLSVPGMERVVTGLRARGIPQLVLAPTSVAEVIAELTSLGATLGVPAAGETAARGMGRELAALEAELGSPAVAIYLEWWPKPMFTPGERCYSNELMRLAGGRNVFGARPGSSLEITCAELVAAAPDVCFVSWCGVAVDKLDPAHLIQREGLQGLRAAQLGAVYPLDERFSGRPGPRMLEAARLMADGIRRARALSAGSVVVPAPAEDPCPHQKIQ